MLTTVADRLSPTLTEPLLSRSRLRRAINDEKAWKTRFEEPLSEVPERTFGSEVGRGVVLTDALIGTFAPADDPLLRQNRCFLYHLGRWDVPVGGMGALTAELESVARRAGAEIRTSAEVVSVATDGHTAEIGCAGGERFQALHVLANVAP